jgi:Peroxidase
MYISGPLTLIAFTASAQGFAFPQFGNFDFNSWIQQNRPTSATRPGTNPNPAGNRGGFQLPSARPGQPQGGRPGLGGSAAPVPSVKPITGGGLPTTGGGQAPGPATGGCPAVWTQISKDLTAIFLAGGQCTDDARAAIRAVFHDCFPGDGCDGSLALPAELSRPENTPMTSTINKLSALAKQRGVGIADMISFAGCKFPSNRIFQSLASKH